MAVARFAVSAAGPTAEVVAAVRGPLQDLGFRKRSGEIFTLELVDGVLGWLGLNHAYRPSEDALEINPVVGVRHQEVERVVADLRDARFHPYVPPTISTPIGYVTPADRYAFWMFPREAPMDSEVAGLVDAVAQYGVPFMTASSGVEELRRLIEAQMGPAGQLAYRHPVVCLLAGDRAGALRALEATLAALGEREDPAAVAFRAFATRFRSRADQPA